MESFTENARLPGKWPFCEKIGIIFEELWEIGANYMPGGPGPKQAYNLQQGMLRKHVMQEGVKKRCWMIERVHAAIEGNC